MYVLISNAILRAAERKCDDLFFSDIENVLGVVWRMIKRGNETQSRFLEITVISVESGIFVVVQIGEIQCSAIKSDKMN